VSHQFKPGEHVLVIGGIRRGQLTTIVGGPFRFRRSDGISPCGLLRNGDEVYELRLPPYPGCCAVAAKTEWLVPILPDTTSSATRDELEKVDG
jgi:hypothetical protein